MMSKVLLYVFWIIAILQVDEDSLSVIYEEKRFIVEHFALYTGVL